MLKIKTQRFHSGPMVSVGMPVYNGEDHLAEAIESVLQQDFEDFEFIISDNASDDKTPEICRHYAEMDNRIKYYRYSENQGSIRNFRRVLEASSGKYFMWASSDDLREKTMISACIPVLAGEPSVVICYPLAESIDEAGNSLGTAMNDSIKADHETPKERFLSVLWNLDICNVLYGLMRGDVLRQVRWPRAKTHGFDHIILSELALLGKFIRIPELLFSRRQGGNRATSTFEEYNNYLIPAVDPGNESQGITLPFCEFALETLNVIKFASSLNEDDRAELIEQTLRCFRTRWGKQVGYDMQRAIHLIHKGEFRRSWGKSPLIKGHKIADQFYISMILTRLEAASFILPGFPGLQDARAICLQQLGRHDEARATASTKQEQEQNSQSNTKHSVRKATATYIEISGVCNGKCLYCAQRRLREVEHSRNIMSPELFEQTLARLLELKLIDMDKGHSISLYNFGEPFLNPRINDILRILKKKSLRARISSNFIVSPDIDEECLPVISSLALSLSGFTQESYGKIHGASLSKTLSNFEKLHDEILRYSPKTYVYIAWHRYLFNENEFWDAYRYFDRPGIHFIPSVAHLNDTPVMVDFLKGKLPEDRRKQAEADLFLDHIHQGLEHIKEESKNYRCPQWDQLAIDETGHLLLCCGVTGYDSEHVLGNILEMSAEDMWEAKSTDSLCDECISAGLARWYHDSSFQMMPPPANSELSLTDVRK